MKKRLFCLFLCLLMVLPVALTGCSQKSTQDNLDDINAEASANNLSLTMWMVSENKISEETAKRINEAVSKITKREFKAALTIEFFTKDEYQQKLNAAIRNFENIRTTASTTQNIPTSTNALEEYYPELLEDQVDIIYIQNEDMYLEYISNGWLSDLNTELSSSSKKINEYISEAILTAAKYQNVTYAIPNNRPVGEYTFMLLNKELIQTTSMDGKYLQGKVDGFFNDAVFTFVEDMVRSGNSNIVPIAADYEYCLDLLAYYWSINPDNFALQEDKFSVLGYRYTDPATLNRGTTVLSFNNLFADKEFVENYQKLNEYRIEGNYFSSSVPAGKTAAVMFQTGTIADYEAYAAEDSLYYPVIVKYPTVTTEEIYNGMFGVFTYTRDLSRSMKIVTYLTTNVEFRNLIQYGILDEDYQIEADEITGVKKVKTLTDDYQMDVFKTGNTFLTYLPKTSTNDDVWENGKKQNLDAKVDPLLNFDFAKEAKTAGVASTSIALGSTGYVYSVTTGYNKAILSQDTFLKSWIEECDQKGNGIYALNTAVTSGQNTTSKIYFYHKGVSNVTVTANAAGNLLTLAYTNAAGTSATPGYEITVVDSYAKKSSVLNFAATVNGTATEISEKKQNALVDFDFLNTDTYHIVVTNNVTKAMIANNTGVLTWIKNSVATAQSPAIMAAKRTVGEKTYYTYLVYAKTSKVFSTTVQPCGDEKNLNVKIKCIAGSEVGTAEYSLTVINVEANNDVAVTLTTDANVTVSNVAVDPKLLVYGVLDTEMVRYFAKLSENVEAKVAACTTVAELDTLMNQLGILFTTQNISKSAFDATAYSAIPDALLQNLLPGYSSRDTALELLNWYLLNATSKEKIAHMGYAVDLDGLVWQEITTDSRANNENFAYFYSPYMVYYTWLKANNLAK